VIKSNGTSNQVKDAVIASLAVVSTLLITGLSFAQEAMTPPSDVYGLSKSIFCDSERTTIAFGNGILTELHTAIQSKAELERAIDENLRQLGKQDIADNTNFVNSYNPKDGLISDLWEVLRDNSNLNTAQYWEAKREISNAPAHIQELFLDNEIKAIENVVNSSPVITQHIQRYHDMLNNGRSVVLVGHSQGTIIANGVYSGIDSVLSSAFGSVLVSAMDDEHLGAVPNLYITSNEDNVARGFRFFINPDALPSNIDNWSAGDPNQPFMAHDFVDHYLNPDLRSYARIIDSVTIEERSLTPKPCHGHTFSKFGQQTRIAFDDDGAYKIFDEVDVANLSNSPLIDWQGRYVGGEATRTLSYHGPLARYNGPAQFSAIIYRDGVHAYTAPNPVLGAALTEDSNGKEYVIAITFSDDSLRQMQIYKKEANHILPNDGGVRALNIETARSAIKQINRDSSTISESNPSGWQLVASKPFTDNTFYYSPWFFNGDGTRARSLRREKTNLFFDKQEPARFCGPNSTDERCTNPDSPFIGHDAKEFEVDVLVQHEYNAFTGAIINLGFEFGDSGVLAVDYLDNQLRVLREVNVDPSKKERTDNNLEDLDASEIRWLEVNGQPLVSPEILNCSTFTGKICRIPRNTAFSTDMGGFFYGWPEVDKQIKLHFYYTDIRTNTFAYSRLEADQPELTVDENNNPILKNPTTGNAEYWLSHSGGRRMLGKKDDVTITVLNGGMHTSRYGPASSFKNNFEFESPSFGEINPMRGQYENLEEVAAIAPVLSESVIKVAPNGAVLASGRIDESTVFNFHSGLPGGLASFLGVNLDNLTILPADVR